MNERKPKQHRGCLVKEVRSSGGKRVTVGKLKDSLIEAHAYLVKQGKMVLERGISDCSPDCNDSFGTDFKRALGTVSLPKEGRAELVDRDSESFIELVNQCATLERLIDALGVIESDGSFRNQTVQVCHPTVTSGRKEDKENDLVLEDGDGKATAKFEVSDISGGGTGAKKDRQDLASLYVLDRDLHFADQWPTDARRFLIVSSELADRISPKTFNERTWRSRWHKGKLKYHRVPPSDDRVPPSVEQTVILEVKQGEQASHI